MTDLEAIAREFLRNPTPESLEAFQGAFTGEVCLGLVQMAMSVPGTLNANTCAPSRAVAPRVTKTSANLKG
jgi:hypothetical protein